MQGGDGCLLQLAGCDRWPVYQVLDLKDLASYLYMVNITAGETLYTERLVIQP